MSSKIMIETICEYCGQSFTARTTKTRFCSHKCASRAYKQRQRTGKISTAIQETQKRKTRSIDEIKAMEFLSINEVCKLIGISRSTIYRMFERGELPARKAGKRTFVRRIDIDRLFEKEAIISDKSKPKEPITEFYTIQEVEQTYQIKYGRLNQIIKKAKIPTTIFNNKLHVSKPDLDRYMRKVRPNVSNIEDWCTVAELMEKYNLTRDQVYGRVSENNIPKKREGKFVKISKKHFDERFQLKISTTL